MLGDSIGALILTGVGSYKSNSSGALLNTHPRNALRTHLKREIAWSPQPLIM